MVIYTNMALVLKSMEDLCYLKSIVLVCIYIYMYIYIYDLKNSIGGLVYTGIVLFPFFLIGRSNRVVRIWARAKSTTSYIGFTV